MIGGARPLTMSKTQPLCQWRLLPVPSARGWWIVGIGSILTAAYAATLAWAFESQSYNVWGSLLVAPVLAAVNLWLIRAFARTEDDLSTILESPGFGEVFTDHMVDLCWSERGGWHRPRVSPYGPIPLDPAAAVLPYSQ